MGHKPQEVAPLIGVTGPDAGGFSAWIFTRVALERVGARVVRVTPARTVDPSRLDGLVVGGGADVTDPLSAASDEIEDPAPTRRPHPLIRWPLRLLDLVLAPLVLLVRMIAGKHSSAGPAPARDALELALLNHAREHNLPVLGICRGAQLMSVAEGGTLLRDLRSLYSERPHLYAVLARRAVRISEGSRLRKVVGRDELLVNSLHFHAVGQAGRDMRIVAREDCGVPQAIEHHARRFWIGVQWHPEYLPHHRAHDALDSWSRKHKTRAASGASLRTPGSDAHPHHASLAVAHFVRELVGVIRLDGCSQRQGFAQARDDLAYAIAGAPLMDRVDHVLDECAPALHLDPGMNALVA